jgi:RNA polymerase sigma factor (sigma-70 family)
MDETEFLASQFEADRTHLRAVAYRMLGSVNEADDAVQEAWLRLSRTDTSDVQNLSGWLTTVVSRVCLDMLRTRTSRREDPLETHSVSAEAGGEGAAAIDPERAAMQADAVGLALLVVLDSLDPAERLAFVLHDMFAVPFDEIATIVGRSPAATRQLASRARRRVQQSDELPAADRSRQRKLVDAFLAASRSGDFEALLTLLDPDVVLRSDASVVAFGAEAEVRGPAAVAATFSGRAKAAESAYIDGRPGAVWMQGGRTRVAFDFTFVDAKIVAIDLLGDPELLAALELTVVNE